MEKASSGRSLDANMEMMPTWKCCPLIYSFELGRIPPKYQNVRTFRLSRSVPIRVDVEVRNP